MDARLRKTIQAYDRIADDYDRQNRAINFWAVEQRLFRRYLPGRNILEIGCGGGRDAHFFLDGNFSYLGIDASQGLLRVAKKRNPKGKFIKRDLLTFDTPSKRWDGIWSMATLLHIPRRNIRSVLRRWRRMLHPNGVLAVSIKIGPRSHERVIHQERYGGVERFFCFYAERTFLRLLRSAGFDALYKARRQENGNDWLVVIAKSR